VATKPKLTALPDPNDPVALRDWLSGRPPAWSVTIAARAALRVLPLALLENHYSLSFEVFLLSLFRANSIARFAAWHPLATDSAYAAAAAAVSRPRTPESHTASFPGIRLALAGASSADAAVFASSTAAAAARRDDVDTYAAAARTADIAQAASHAFRDISSATVFPMTEDLRNLEAAWLTPEALARAPLWSRVPGEISDAWASLSSTLIGFGPHWQVWTDWYDAVLTGSAPGPERGEDWEAAFTDLPGLLPWDDGPDAVNAEIARRLAALQDDTSTVPDQSPEQTKTAALARLSEVASPQPSLTPDGRLDAGPNPAFDIPTLDADLPALPVRQRVLIANIVESLTPQAPRHLASFLHSYDEELKVRGAQPIVGILKDMADVIAADVRAPRADDEWLEAGLRQAFNRFAENHSLLMQHFPLDAEREGVFADIPVDEPVDEEKATGDALKRPFESVANASEEAHRAGMTTQDFATIVDKMRVCEGDSDTAPCVARHIVAAIGRFSIPDRSFRPPAARLGQEADDSHRTWVLRTRPQPRRLDCQHCQHTDRRSPDREPSGGRRSALAEDITMSCYTAA
jgi:hypothetical protein